MTLGVDSADAEPVRARRAVRASQLSHVHQLHFEHTGDHEHSFVRSYVGVEEVMLGFGFGPLLPQRLRLMGCPPGSYAGSMQGTPRPQPTQPAN
jgi:hypothetical protein